VGAENEGWSVAKQLMSMARSNNTTSGHLHRALRRARALIASRGGTDALHMKASVLSCDVRAFESLEMRSLEQGSVDALKASLTKTLATELHQQIIVLGLEAAGYAATVSPTISSSADWLAHA
jgi:acyl-CoA dehydrogenase